MRYLLLVYTDQTMLDAMPPALLRAAEIGKEAGLQRLGINVQRLPPVTADKHGVVILELARVGRELAYAFGQRPARCTSSQSTRSTHRRPSGAR